MELYSISYMSILDLSSLEQEQTPGIWDELGAASPVSTMATSSLKSGLLYITAYFFFHIFISEVQKQQFYRILRIILNYTVFKIIKKLSSDSTFLVKPGCLHNVDPLLSLLLLHFSASLFPTQCSVDQKT